MKSQYIMSLLTMASCAFFNHGLQMGGPVSSMIQFSSTMSYSTLKEIVKEIDFLANQNANEKNHHKYNQSQWQNLMHSQFHNFGHSNVDVAKNNENIYVLLAKAVSVVPPNLYEKYIKLFNDAKYFECYLLIASYICPDGSQDSNIIQALEILNSNIHYPTCFVFFDYSTKKSLLCPIFQKEDSSPHNLHCNASCFYLPKQVLSFEAFVCLDLKVDALIISQLAAAFRCQVIEQIYMQALDAYKHFLLSPHHNQHLAVQQYLKLKFLAIQLIAYVVNAVNCNNNNVISQDNNYSFVLQALSSIFSARPEAHSQSYELFFRAYSSALKIVTLK